MDFLARPSSQIQRQIEASLLNAYELQLHVDQLVQRIKAFEEEAHRAAAEYYDPEDIPSALKFARMSLPSILALKKSAQKSSTENVDTPSTSDPVSPSALTALPVSEANNTVKYISSDNDHIQKNPDFFGVRVPPHRADEANAILDEAQAASRKNQKENPYASDRGKNAWRSHLFAAALDAYFLQNQSSQSESVFTLSNEVAVDDIDQAAQIEISGRDGDLLDDAHHFQTVTEGFSTEECPEFDCDVEGDDILGQSFLETDMSEGDQSLTDASDETCEPDDVGNGDETFFAEASEDQGSYYDDIPFFDDEPDHLVRQANDQRFQVDASSYTDDVPEAASLTDKSLLLEDERRPAALPAHARVIRPEDVPVSARNFVPAVSVPRRTDIPVHAQARVIQRPDLQQSSPHVVKPATTAEAAPIQEQNAVTVPTTRPATPPLKRPAALQPPMRQVGYGNAVPAPDGLDAALEKRRRQEEAAGKPITPEPEVRVTPPRTAPPLRPSFAAPTRK